MKGMYTTMEEWILTGYELITVMLPALLLAGIAYRSNAKQQPKAAVRHSLFLIAFAVYLYGVFHFTVSGTIFHIKQYGIRLRAEEANLVPFSDASFDPVGYGLNVLLFLPLGFLLPFLWERYHTPVRACGFGFLLSLMVELSQLLNIRATDVDDLICNMLGTAFGFLCFRLYFCISKQTARACRSHAGVFEDTFPYEAYLFTALLFLCRFFTFYELGMAKALYHF